MDDLYKLEYYLYRKKRKWSSLYRVQVYIYTCYTHIRHWTRYEIQVVFVREPHIFRSLPIHFEIRSAPLALRKKVDRGKYFLHPFVYMVSMIWVRSKTLRSKRSDLMSGLLPSLTSLVKNAKMRARGLKADRKLKSHHSVSKKEVEFHLQKLNSSRT